MKKLIPLLVLFLFAGCSFREWFVVKNRSDAAVTVNYKLSEANGFPVFDRIPQAYKASRDGEISWENPVTLTDHDSTELGYSFSLPPDCILSFGELSNDNYLKHDQEFINDRIFNFVEMEIRKKDGEIKITKEQFDSYFKKKNGYITYEIK